MINRIVELTYVEYIKSKIKGIMVTDLELYLVVEYEAKGLGLLLGYCFLL